MTESGSGNKKDAPITLDVFDPIPSIHAAAAALDASGTPFALIGGVALDAWGVPRATKDVDFAVPYGKAEEVAKLLEAPSLQTRPLRIGGVALRDAVRNLRIDFIDRRFYFGPLFREAIAEAAEAARKVRVGERDVPLVSLEYLLAMKLVSGEDKDDIDAGRILRLKMLDYKKAREIIERHLGPATANRADKMARVAGRPEVRRELYDRPDQGDEE